MTLIKTAAQAMYESGLCVLPVSPFGNRLPITTHLPTNPTSPDKKTWKPFQTERPTQEQIDLFFSGETRRKTNIGVLCGDVSGGLLVLDFDHDAKENFPKFREQINKKLWDRLTISQTGKGWHIWFRAKGELPTNKALARKPDENGRGIILIEIASNGRIITAPPSWHNKAQRHYRAIQGSLLDIPTLNVQETDRLIQVAQSFDKMPKRESKKKLLVIGGQEISRSLYINQNADNGRIRAYAQSALRNLTAELSNLANGRNNALNETAFWLFRYVGAGVLEKTAVISALTGACEVNGLIQEDGQHSFEATLASGAEKGLQETFTDTELQDKVTRHTHPALELVKPELTPEQKAQVSHIIHELQEKASWLKYHEQIDYDMWQAWGFPESICDAYELGCHDNQLTVPVRDMNGDVIDVEFRGEGKVAYKTNLPHLNWVKPLWLHNKKEFDNSIILTDSIQAIHAYLAWGDMEVNGRSYRIASTKPIDQDTIIDIPRNSTIVCGYDIDPYQYGIAFASAHGVDVLRLPTKQSQLHHVSKDSLARWLS